jgi:pentapeptide MXKDX repeat protein
MRRLITSIICAGFVCAGTQAVADDSMQSDTPTMATQHQMMKDCMAKHAAQNDGMSKTDIKKACGDEIKMQKDSGNLKKKVPTDSPTNDKKIGTGETSNN